MDIRFDDDRPLQKGSFSAEIKDGDLRLPREMERFFTDTRIPKHAENFTMYINHFPGAIPTVMGWTPEEAESARSEICQQLKGHVPDRNLEQRPVTARAPGIPRQTP